MKKIYVIILVFSLLLPFIGCKCNCDDEMAKKRSEWGDPEEVNTYSSSGYNSEDWWYWSKGIEFTFEWGSSVDGCCKVSTYTFTPISASSPREQKSEIKASKKLKNRKIDVSPIFR